MRIIYVAKHDQSTGNDDEGAIHHALTELGHDVQRVREVKGRGILKMGGDLLLFHHWHDLPMVKAMGGKMPRAFWYFDLVESPGNPPELALRDATRVAWMREAMDVTEIGFCTDGDWAAKHPEKLVWLPQGADGRIVGRGDASRAGICGDCGAPRGEVDILFTGGVKGCGRQRESFVEEMRARWGHRFRHVTKGLYRESLRDAIAGAKIVVCPDYPVTDRYWSNRVWIALGFGAFLLHPDSAGVHDMLSTPGEQPSAAIPYRGREELHDLIRDYLELPRSRKLVAESGLELVRSKHLYRHRCEELIRTVKERLGC